MEKLYHIQLDDSHGAKYALLPGDPGRVEKIAMLLDDPHFIGRNREYTTWLGTLLGEPILVMSTGMGGPSTRDRHRGIVHDGRPQLHTRGHVRRHGATRDGRPIS